MGGMLKRIAVVTLALLAIPVGGATLLWARAATSNVGQLGFENALRIPPLLEPTEQALGHKVFELELQEGAAELRPGQSASTWGFNGPYLGPTLRASRGDHVEMRVRNGLSETSTVHWHGMHLPAEADGGPHQMIEPGETWSPSWTIDQPAASLWYHPHPHGKTEAHVYRGLAGMFILDDPRSRALTLPDRYGVDDVPVIVQDKRFDDDGELSESKALISPIGQLGDKILVNGTSDPHLAVSTTRVRLRLLNASSARTYNFGFSDDREFDLIASDGGLLDAPQRLDRVQLSPGERAEVVLEIEPGEDIVLRSFKPDLGDVDFFNQRFVGADDSFDILELRAARELAESPPVPDTLVAQEEPKTAGAAVRRFELGSRDINDLKMDMGRIDQTVPVDTTEIWEIENEAGIPHNFHPHGTSFRVLEVAGETPPPALSGPKDTVQVPPGETVRVAIRFSDYGDPATPFMFHCHLLEHEDRGMMGQFVVVEPDQLGNEKPETEDHQARRSPEQRGAAAWPRDLRGVRRDLALARRRVRRQAQRDGQVRRLDDHGRRHVEQLDRDLR
jgi:blue copper oxidase